MVALPRTQRPNVMVGYDGTEENDVALRWAVEESRLRGLDLMICYCWHWPYPQEHVDGNVQAVIQRAGENLLREGAHRARRLGASGKVHTRLRREPVCETLVRESDDAELIVVGSHERYPKVRVEVSPLLERPREALLAAAADADLLVVGDRGTGGFDPLLLGATSSAMLHHAPCAVAIVPPPRHAA